MIASRRLIASSLILACSIGVAACGKSEDTSAAQVAISQGFLNSTEPKYEFTTTQTACLAKGIVADFGVEKAVTYKFLGANNQPLKNVRISLPAAAADTFATTFITCINPTNSLVDQIVTLVETAKGQASTVTPDVEAALRTCVQRNLTPARLHAGVVTMFTSDTASAAEWNEVFSACQNLG